MDNVTLLLSAAAGGGVEAEHQLWEAVYAELRHMAEGKMRREGREVTLQATVLVHEVWLRLAGTHSTPQVWDGRAHFFFAAAEAMRRILLEHARRRLTRKRGGGVEHVAFEERLQVISPLPDERLLQVNEVLDALALEDPRKAELVKLKFFVGCTNEEAAMILDVGEKTVRRQWGMAKKWLHQAILSAPAGSA